MIVSKVRLAKANSGGIKLRLKFQIKNPEKSISGHVSISF
jgi:hypothetical protein